MSEELNADYRDERTKKPRVYGLGLCAARVEVERDEADGDVQCFSRDLVAVYEGAPVPMDGYQAERARGARQLPPVIRCRCGW